MFLEQFIFPTAEAETDFIWRIMRTCYDSCYPFQILSKHRFQQIDFAPITILYGGNGSGKTTALNIIAEALAAERGAVYNRSNFFADYVERCQFTAGGHPPAVCKVITSDDVFDYMLNIRTLNEGIDAKREALFEDYLSEKYSTFRFTSMADLEQLKKVNKARSKTQSQYVRSELMDNVREHSNGENALRFFMEQVQENGLYLLDEPENSLSAVRQQEMVQFLTEAARFFNCQLIIATHSPFVLAMKGAKIYDLDEEPVDVKTWTQLANVRETYDFFKAHEAEFDRGR